MIPTNAALRQVPGWQHELARAFTQPEELLDFLRLDQHFPVLDPSLRRRFPLRVPRSFAARMVPGDPHDPLFLQVWPRTEEAEVHPGYADDAVGDLERLRRGGIIHKYEGRALVVATGACAVHCRYCFRRHFPYNEAIAARDHWRLTLSELSADRSITEVILSGGDPLGLSDDKLAAFAEALDFLPHVRRLRIHTRLPIVLPSRVDDALLGWLRRGRLHKVMVVHVNHARELDSEVASALQRIRALGIPLLNQSVLLRGVNDSVSALQDLSERLFETGVLPYYLHLLDRVQGAAHFDIPEPEARSLMKDLAARLPGYLVPRLVRDEPGQPAKTLVA